MSLLFALAGPPGCGKGTILDCVIRPYCVAHSIPLIVFPVSAELQAYLDEQENNKAAHIREMQKAGYLLPDDIANMALARAVEKNKGSAEKTVYVIDGAPRTTGQIETSLIKVAETLSIPRNRRRVIRFTTRAHLCGFRARGRGREDDTEESFQVRWSEFESKTRPALQFIEHQQESLGVRLMEVDGAGIRKSPELFKSVLFGGTDL
ncbi:MAG: adenylate kinase [Candidatus Parcubacteria bacterium]|jgi:adenylate kinase family enzyme